MIMICFNISGHKLPKSFASTVFTRESPAALFNFFVFLIGWCLLNTYKNKIFFKIYKKITALFLKERGSCVL